MWQWVKMSVKNSIKIWPNPFSDKIIINLSSEINGSATVQLSNIDGKLLMTKTLGLINGSNQMVVDKLANLPSGVYLLQILNNTNGSKTVEKIIK